MQAPRLSLSSTWRQWDFRVPTPLIYARLVLVRAPVRGSSQHRELSPVAADVRGRSPCEDLEDLHHQLETK